MELERCVLNIDAINSLKKNPIFFFQIRIFSHKKLLLQGSPMVFNGVSACRLATTMKIIQP